MKLSLKYELNLSNKQLNIINELSFHTTKLYNIANYECRENQYKNYIDLEKELKSNWHREYLHSHTYQQCLKTLEQNWKSYFKSIKDYKKNPNKYLGMPKPPKYKNDTNKKNEVIFTNLAIRVKGNTILLSLSKKIQSMFKVKSLNFNLSNKIKSLINIETIQQIRIKWDNSLGQWYLIIIYKKQELDNINAPNIMAIDLGLSNLATITFKDNIENFVINGKPLKSVNSYINKEVSRLQCIEMKKHGSANFKDTHRIKSLRKYRNNYINNYLHKASRKVINIALENNVGKIVIGDIKNIKQNMNYNKTFVQVPINRLIELINYKAKLLGVEVILTKESYTSGVSSLDLEPIKKSHYDKSRRIKRGLFKSNCGLNINADVNGSLNIMRKYLKDECIPKLIEIAKDKGVVNTPCRIRVA